MMKQKSKGKNFNFCSCCGRRLLIGELQKGKPRQAGTCGAKSLVSHLLTERVEHVEQ